MYSTCTEKPLKCSYFLEVGNTRFVKRFSGYKETDRLVCFEAHEVSVVAIVFFPATKEADSSGCVEAKSTMVSVPSKAKSSRTIIGAFSIALFAVPLAKESVSELDPESKV